MTVPSLTHRLRISCWRSSTVCPVNASFMDGYPRQREAGCRARVDPSRGRRHWNASAFVRARQDVDQLANPAAIEITEGPVLADLDQSDPRVREDGLEERHPFAERQCFHLREVR